MTNDQTSKSTERPLCFVIGPIGKDGSDERKHADLLLNLVIKHVLEHGEFGYHVKRADEDPQPGMIGDRVITDVINAPLVVADLTGLNANAFYELGIRHAKIAPTIHIAKSGTPLPFDNVTHSTIFVDLSDYRSIESARTSLSESTRTVRAPGFRVSNPITQARASFAMRESADPMERIVSSMQEKLTAIEARLDSALPNVDTDEMNWFDILSASKGEKTKKELAYLKSILASPKAKRQAGDFTGAIQREYWRLRGNDLHQDKFISDLIDFYKRQMLPVIRLQDTGDHLEITFDDGSIGHIFKGPRK
jgi:hypothetical protein